MKKRDEKVRSRKMERERWRLKQRQQRRVQRCSVPTFLHKNKRSFDLGNHPWTT